MKFSMTISINLVAMDTSSYLAFESTLKLSSKISKQLGNNLL